MYKNLNKNIWIYLWNTQASIKSTSLLAFNETNLFKMCRF